MTTLPRRCESCGRSMWLATLPGVGDVFNCVECKATVLPSEERVEWRMLSEEPTGSPPDRPGEKRYRSTEPCPECGKPMWAVQIPDYGERKQCEDCRLTIVFGGTVLRWR